MQPNGKERSKTSAPCAQGAAFARSLKPGESGGAPLLWILLSWLGMFTGTGAALAASGSNGLLGDEDLYQLTVRELETRLARPERFTALPANVAEVFCPEGGTPLFFVANEGRQQPPSAKPSDYVEDRGAFRVLRSGLLLGASAEEVVVIGARERSAPGPISVAVRDVAVVGKTGVRHLQSPHYQPVIKAFPAASGWGFVSSRGVLLHSTTNLDEVDLKTKDHLARVIGGPNDYAILTRPRGFVAGENPGPLVINTRDPEGTKTIEFVETQAQALACQGLVRSRAGQWLAIGVRIAPMAPEQPATPPEQLLTAVLKAVKAGDRSALSNALESATVYSPEQLRGLSQLLQAMPEPLGSVRYLESAARESLRSARAWKPPEGVSSNQQAQAAGAVADYAKNLEQFLQKMERIRGGALGASPQMLASLIENGFQHFSGWWIGAPRLLHQQSPRSALIDCTFLSQSNSVRRGIFRLDETGRLQLLGDYGPALDSARRNATPLDDRPERAFSPLWLNAGRENETPLRKPCEYAGEEGQGIFLFFPFQGLARLAGGTFDWVDRSEPFKRMERLAGTDSEGRIYMISAPALMSHARTGGRSSAPGEFSPWAYPAVMGGRGGDLWVFRRKAPPPASPIRALIPVVSLPVMDSEQRVWFLPLRPSQVTPWPYGPGALGDTPAAETAGKALLAGLVRTAEPKPPAYMFPADVDIAGGTTDLCCYDAGRITVGATNVPFQMVLAAGNSGSLMGYSWTPKVSKAFLLDKSGLAWGDSLHTLAQNVPARLLQAALSQACPSSIFVPNYDFSSQMDHPTIARTGDYLWVHHGGRIEVYRDGKALGVQERLTLLNCPAKLTLQGPLNASVGTAMLVVGTQSPGFSRPRDSGKVFWAVPTNNTVELFPGPEKDMDPSCEVPLVNPAKGRLYLPRFVSPVSFWIVSAPDRAEERSNRGVPMWVTRAGDLLTARSERGYAGWRLEADDLQRDVPLSYASKLRIVHETRDGTLVCQSPEGVAWLRRTGAGDYVAAGETRLGTGGFVLSFVGETNRELFLTVVDARQNAYLAVLNKP